MRFSRRSFATLAAASPFVASSGSLGQEATPSADDFGVASVRFNDLLQFAPGGVLDEALNVVWVDIERQVSVVRQQAEDPASSEDVFGILAQSAFGNIPLFFDYLFKLEELAGFSAANILQALQFGEPPNVCQVMMLDIEADTLIPFWESLDYQERENDYGSFWTIGEDGDFSFEHPVQQAFLARFNNIAIFNDHIIAYAPTAELIHQLMATVNGDAPNKVAELEPVSFGMPEDASSAWYMDGDILSESPQQVTAELQAHIDEMLSESDAAVGAMPAIRTIGTGTTSGAARDAEQHQADARTWLLIETDAPNMAQQAADVFTWRVENMISTVNGQPYNELIGEFETEIVSDTIVCFSAQGMAAQRALFPTMMNTRDILPLTFVPES